MFSEIIRVQKLAKLLESLSDAGFDCIIRSACHPCDLTVPISVEMVEKYGFTLCLRECKERFGK